MAVHDLHEILGPPEVVPINAEWFLKNFSPMMMAQLLARWMQQDASMNAATIELERKYAYQRPAGPFDAVNAMEQVLAHKSRFAASSRTKKYRQLAIVLQPFWNSDRFRFGNNARWAEEAIRLPLAVKFMKDWPRKISSDAVTNWPSKYDWDPEAKNHPVS